MSSLLSLLVLFMCLNLVRPQRSYCFSGTSEYQAEVVECSEKNPSYNGNWYCATMEICEQFKNSDRNCIISRGCATEEQCTDGSGNIYHQTKNTESGERIGGMTVTTSCCLNDNDAFYDDDLIAVDLSGVCNAAGRTATAISLGTAATAVLSILLYGM